MTAPAISAQLTTTLQALIDQEGRLTAEARARLGSFVDLAAKAMTLLNTFVASVGAGHFLAAGLQLAIQKAATLAFLSYIRQHLAQAEFNMRQVVEFCSLCAYLLAHPAEEVTQGADDKPDGFKPPKVLSGKAYKWLEKEHPHHSQLLLEIKSQINESSSHASVYLTHFTLDWEASGVDEYRGSFFDNVEPDVSRLYLMSFARIIVIVVDTLRLVSQQHGGFVIREGVRNELVQLERAVDAHRVSLSERMGLPLR